MSAFELEEFNRVALDPARSVVVEACAGSGKTWLLVSRIVRLLLAGVPPSQILAITFTRKASQEMTARLRDWLKLLATENDEAVRGFLRARAVPECELDLLQARARGLYEATLTAQPPLTIATFHAWFLQLLKRAPLDAGTLGDVTLAERTSAMMDEAWERFAQQLQRRQGSNDAAARGLDLLFRDHGLDNTRKLLVNFLYRRGEWRAFTQAREESAAVAFALAEFTREMEAAPNVDVIAEFFGDRDIVVAIEKFAGLLARNTPEDRKEALTLLAALERKDSAASFEAIAAHFLKANGQPYARKTSTAQRDRLGADEARFIELHHLIAQRLAAGRRQLADQHAYRFNEAALHCGVALLAAYDAVKRERRMIDYADIESRAFELLSASDHAAYLQYKLDSRYRHILIDEFQDTNPVQWLTLKAWFDASADADTRPTVFLVGDPKQSIYRFRRAEPRLFDEAIDYLRRHFNAELLSQNDSRRCAPAIIKVVNRVFESAPAFEGFSAHTAHFADKPGVVEAVPLATIAAAPAPIADQTLVLRNPLTTAFSVEEDLRREREAAQLVVKLREIVGHWEIWDDQRGERKRLVRYGDVLLLVRRRTHLATYERALRHADIPFLTSRQGGLLDSLEALDLTALLEFLVSPFADLKLAHALRSPLFGCDDHDLIALARAPGRTWWERLQYLFQGGCSPTLARACRLLDDWLAHADMRPVHDQLDRIYFEGDILRRYQAAVPAAFGTTVAANLRAFMQYALDTDSGRYPSLPRFLDELRDMRSAPGEEAPDQGAVDAAAANDAVRIHTIHGAKGLEAPVVWLLDSAGGGGRDDSYSVLVDWPPAAHAPCQISLRAKKEDLSTAQRRQLQVEAELVEREDWNLLYVAMTRAQQVLLVSGCQGRGVADSWYAKIAAALKAEGAIDGIGTRGFSSALKIFPQNAADLQATTATILAEIATDPPLAMLQPLPAGTRETESARGGRRYGTLFHAVMERLAANPALEQKALQHALGQLGFGEHETAAAYGQARDLHSRAELARFFNSQCYLRALNEVAVMDAAGRILRIDRLVEFDHEWWVLDYKTDILPPAAQAAIIAAAAEPYRAQLAAYRDAVRYLRQDKPVQAAVLFSNGHLYSFDFED